MHVSVTMTFETELEFVKYFSRGVEDDAYRRGLDKRKTTGEEKPKKFKPAKKSKPKPKPEQARPSTTGPESAGTNEPPSPKFIMGVLRAWAAKMGGDATAKLIKKLAVFGVKRVPEIPADKIRAFLDELEAETINA